MADVVPVPHRMRSMAAVVLVLLVAWFAISVAKNPNIGWHTVGQYIDARTIFDSIWTTLEIAALAMFFTVVLGIAIAALAMSKSRILAGFAKAYVWIFRSMPLLVLVLICGNFALLFPNLGIRIPFTSVVLVEVQTNSVITIFMAAVIALSLHAGAYMAEIVRGGILAVGSEQGAAALALGLTPRQAMRKVVLPQAIRLILPASGNQLILLVKETSLVSVIGGGDLLTTTQNIASTTYKTVALLTVATFWYLVIVAILSRFQALLEQRMGRAHVQAR